MFYHRVLTAVAILCVGCGSMDSPPTYGDTRDVEVSYRPLETMSERPDVVLSSSALTTVGNVVYTANLSKWLRENPPGSSTYHATMLHEQAHSERQLRAGVMSWIAKYMTDADFMWREEQIGWYREIRALVASGHNIDLEAVAASLSAYRTIGGARMVSHVEAREWAFSVVTGQWSPPPD